MSNGIRPTGFVARAVVVAVTLLALGVICAAAVRQWQSVGHRFAGFAVYGSMTVDRLNQPYWTGIRAGLLPGDRILAVDGVPIRSYAVLARAVRAVPEGTLLRYSVARGDQTLDVEVPTMTFRWVDFVESYALYAVTALVFVIGAAAIAWFRLDALGLGLFCFSTAIALAIGGGIQLALHDPLASEGLLSIPLVAAAILHLAMVFPETPSFLLRRPAWLVLPYAAMLPLAAPRILFAVRGERAPVIFDEVNRAVPLAAGLALMVSLLRARRLWTHGIRAERVRVVQVGATVAVVIHAVGFLATELAWMPPAPNLTFLLPAWVWIATLSVASVRLDLFDLGAASRAELARGAVFVVTVVLYLASFGTAALAVATTGRDPRIWIVAAALLLVAIVAYEPLSGLARRIVESPAGAKARRRSSAFREISQRLAAALDLETVEAAVQTIAHRFRLTGVRLLIGDGRDGSRGPAAVSSTALASPGEVLLAALAPVRSAPGTGEADLAGAEIETDEQRRALEQLGLSAGLPLRVQGRPLGVLGLGSPLRGGLISIADLRLLAALADQVALALENTRTLERIRDLERAVSAENVVLKEELLAKPGPGGLVGQSAAMRELLAWIEQAAGADATVLLRGETGTGKELVARALHAASRRKDRPMIRINCAAVPAGLLEAEFFGHERGAFTGAHARKLGRFELADGGTLFLDEIGDLPGELQPKLLRALQEHRFERVGGSSSIAVDVRLIAATNRDLDSLVRAGRFREDLFFRLNVLPFTVAPLRERHEDIPALIAHFLRGHEARVGRPLRGIDARSLRDLLAYRWPGNVRELENVIERAVILSRGEHLVVRDPASAARPEVAAARVRPLAAQLEDAKIRAIRRALSRGGGNQARAAEILGLRPSSLSRMMKRLDLRSAGVARRRSGRSALSSGTADSA